ncbi:hypothetical protein KR044_004338 [Drosophila immigrans]|nr:hypothetical protein KR044_004338 [Drosophila immigrans]
MAATSSSSGCSSGQSSSMEGSRNCCLVLLQKLRRTLQRHLRPRQRRCGFRRRAHGARAPLLRPMPRCSSFGSSGTLLTPTKRGPTSKATPTDGQYAKWKCMFEHAANGGKKRSVATAHDISEALSGQTTPRGFPSHTDARRCSQHLQLEPVVEQPLYDCLSEQQKVRRRLSFRLPLSSGGAGGSAGSVRRLSARQKAAQAKLEAQLQRELRDLEDYYGGFHYARRNERRI